MERRLEEMQKEWDGRMEERRKKIERDAETLVKEVGIVAGSRRLIE